LVRDVVTDDSARNATIDAGVRACAALAQDGGDRVQVEHAFWEDQRADERVRRHRGVAEIAASPPQLLVKAGV
jgi:polysaccharide deacetylase 2 family uncharacterized protein YibQ